MSRTQKIESQAHVPKKVKRAYRRSTKAKAKQVLGHQGSKLAADPDTDKAPERDPTSDAWKYL